MNSESRHELSLLEAVEQDGHVTQRSLATKLGIALGLTNIYLKRLVHKGYIKVVNAQSNRLRYLLTPHGVAEKSRLTYEFMQYSAVLYRQSRSRLRQVLEPYGTRPGTRVVIYGTGEAAELAYLCLRELGLEPAAIFDEGRGGRFLGLPVRAIGEHESVAYDVMIVATLDHPAPLIDRLLGAGVSASKLLPLRPMSNGAGSSS